MGVHLHLHTADSVGDGLILPKKLASRAKELGFLAVAITDHRTLAGAVRFTLALEAEGIKPILGCEVNETPAYEEQDYTARAQAGSFHLVLLARTQKGWENLVRLVSDAHSKSGGLVGGKPWTGVEKIHEEGWGEGLIALTACRQGRLPVLLSQGAVDEAGQFYRLLRATFDEVYLEVQAHSEPEQLECNAQVMEFARLVKGQLVLTRDVHFLKAEEAPYHTAWQQAGRWGKEGYDSHELYFASDDEMLAFCDQYGIPRSAWEITEKIADACNAHIRTGSLLMPKYPRLEPGVSEEWELTREVYLRLADYLRSNPELDGETYRRRLEKELLVICGKGYAGYFLVVADAIRHAREHGMSIGPGRGSGAGALVSFLMGITRIDPIRYGLLFERFLNPERESPPDIDTDVSDEARPLLIQYFADTYGRENVAQIATRGQVALRQGLRDAARALGWGREYTDVLNELCNLVPAKLPDQQSPTLEDMLEMSNPERRDEYEERFGPKVEDMVATSLAFRTAMKQYPQVEELVRHFAGLTRSVGLHAGGIVVSPVPILSVAPTTELPKAAVLPAVQWDLKDLETVGLVKLDLLGLSTLTIIERTIALAGEPIDVQNLDLRDAALYQDLKDGTTHGLFQAEGRAVLEVARRMQPSTFEDVIDLLSLARPGPMTAKVNEEQTMVDAYVAARQGATLDPNLEPIRSIVKPTWGILLYQEQLMEVARQVAGYSLGGADLFRRAIGKKKPEVLKQLEEEFVAGAIKNGFEESYARWLFAQLMKYSGYAFNRSHSAAYALLTMQTAYLKHYYPVEFVCSLLTHHTGKPEKQLLHLQEARRLRIPLLPPSVNHSQPDFTVERFLDGQKAIRFGLLGVRNLGEKAVIAIMACREQGPFADLEDFLSRVGNTRINRGVMARLIRAGAFDWLDENRFAVWNAYHELRKFKPTDDVTAKGNVYVPYDPREWSVKAKLKWEVEELGVYLTGHPADGLPGGSFDDAYDGARVEVGGLVLALRTFTDKNNRQMATVRLDTPFGERRCVIFAKEWKKLKKLFAEGQLVVVRGYKEEARQEVIVQKAVSAAEYRSRQELRDSLPCVG